MAWMLTLAISWMGEEASVLRHKYMVGVLVRQLGHNDFHVRYKAEASLKRLDWRVVRYLPSNHQDPEITARLSQVRLVFAQDRLDSFAPFPEIDAAWYDDKIRQYTSNGWPVWGKATTRSILEPYLNRIGRDNPPWHNYRLATREWVQDMLDAGVPEWFIRLCLAEMRRRDDVFLNSHAEKRQL